MIDFTLPFLSITVELKEALIFVDAMAIYYYFPSKRDLLEAVIVSLIKDIYEPTGQEDWCNELKRLCKSYLNLLKEHPGLLETLLKMQSEGPSEIFKQRFQLTLRSLNLNEAILKNAMDLLVDYLHGFVLAMNCNPDNEQLEIEISDGPLDFYIKAIISESVQ